MKKQIKLYLNTRLIISLFSSLLVFIVALKFFKIIHNNIIFLFIGLIFIVISIVFALGSYIIYKKSLKYLYKSKNITINELNNKTIKEIKSILVRKR